ncbi:MAG: serine/threonine protein kinase, partial [Myxococcales bacterium]|nr:serine/threonine protein kinase [Myxococcales bacterium]
VYRATRASAGVRRRVALKVLRPELDGELLLEHFQRERETLAALEHDHIVSFVDAGALPDGRPFLAMEYVEGATLSRWGAGVPRRARIELFLKVLAAVQYAHRMLVVHRDLKPSNVLVTPQGAPKLLDFGVAALLDVEGAAARVRAPLTPAYASPEQLRGAPVTTASDLYSLGVLLHELLTGALPEDDDARARGGLPYDLWAISQKARARDPARRYQSADELAHDLRRFLAHEPIAAASRSWAHRARLFVRRHRFPVSLAAAVVAATITGWVGSELDRRHAAREATHGWGAHAEAKLVARVLERWMLESSSADRETSRRATRFLERALEEDARARPEAELLLRLTLAELYLARGERERAARHVERAWALARSTRGVGKADRARVAELSGRLARGA